MTITTTINTSKRSISERLLDCASSDVSDAELLSLFINRKGEVSPLDRARAVLKNTSLIKLIRNPHTPELRALGLTKKQLVQIQAGMELALRAASTKIENVDALTSPDDVRKYLALQMSGWDDERFAVLFLSNRHVPLAFSTISYGTIDCASVFPRTVLKECLKHNANACILTHNHPSNVSAEPSQSDIRLTRKLVDGLNICDIRVLDHIIYSQGISTSLAERGLM